MHLTVVPCCCCAAACHLRFPTPPPKTRPQVCVTGNAFVKGDLSVVGKLDVGGKLCVWGSKDVQPAAA